MGPKNGAIAVGAVATGVAAKYLCGNGTSSSEDTSQDDLKPEGFVDDLKGGLKRIGKRGISLKHVKKDKTVLIVGLVIISLLGGLVLFIYLYFFASSSRKGMNPWDNR